MALQMSDLLARIQQTYESQKSSFPAYRWVSGRDYQVHNFMCEVKKERIPQHWNRHDTAQQPPQKSHTHERLVQLSLKQQPEVQHSKNMKLKRFFSIEFKQLHLLFTLLPSRVQTRAHYSFVLWFFSYFLSRLMRVSQQPHQVSAKKKWRNVENCFQLLALFSARLIHSFIHQMNENCSLSNRAEFSNSRKKRRIHHRKARQVESGRAGSIGCFSLWKKLKKEKCYWLFKGKYTYEWSVCGGIE